MTGPFTQPARRLGSELSILSSLQTGGLHDNRLHLAETASSSFSLPGGVREFVLRPTELKSAMSTRSSFSCPSEPPEQRTCPHPQEDPLHHPLSRRTTTPKQPSHSPLSEQLQLKAFPIKIPKGLHARAAGSAICLTNWIPVDKLYPCNPQKRRSQCTRGGKEDKGWLDGPTHHSKELGPRPPQNKATEGLVRVLPVCWNAASTWLGDTWVFRHCLRGLLGIPGGSVVKNPRYRRLGWSLGSEDPLEEGVANPPSDFA